MNVNGTNVLEGSVVDVFAERFAPNAVLLHSIAAGRTKTGEMKRKLATIGVVIDKHSQLPDVLLHDSVTHWLYAIDIGRPVTRRRSTTLRKLASSCSMGISIVSAFADRDAWCKCVDQIAWETAVWIADEPEHLIYYNGDRFVGRR